MATHMHGGMRLTVRAVPLNHYEYEYFAERYRALRRAGTSVASVAAQASVGLTAAAMIAVVFLAIGAPLWLAGLFAAVSAAVPPIVVWRAERRRLRDHHPAAEAA
jgi:O-antigen/teichoic acid export membrane protein